MVICVFIKLDLFKILSCLTKCITEKESGRGRGNCGREKAMKFMKLGSKPDTFYTAETLRSVSCEVSTDIIIQVNGSRYLLHKFPLLSKCLHLRKLCAESPDRSQLQIIQLPDFPGGIESFELCAKFCYGIAITLGAYNIVAARCAAEYLQMTEDAEKGNLIYKIEVFFNSCVLNGWKDSILTLKSTKSFPSWSEDLVITNRCIEAIASKVRNYPSDVILLHSNSQGGRDDVSCSSVESHTNKPWSRGFWGEDIAELSVDLYWRTMIAIKSSGNVPSSDIGMALQIYASRWFPSRHGSVKRYRASDTDPDNHGDKTSRYRLLLESIASLLPADRNAVPTSFLFKLLKAANKLDASSSTKTELGRRAGIQLEGATLNDLLIPLSSNADDATKYDVDVVLVILEQFMAQGQSPPTSPPRIKGRLERRRTRSEENTDLKLLESLRSSSASHGSKLKVAKLVDRYLQEIANDPNLPLSKMVAVAQAAPDIARVDHDDLYKAINIYLKAHPELNKSGRKKLCRILNCEKLSMEACIHAAQNELLPLRVVVQVLFFEHVRVAMAGGKVPDLQQNIKTLLASSQNEDSSRPPITLSSKTMIPPEDRWSVSGLKSPKPKLSTPKMKLSTEGADDDENDIHRDAFTIASPLKVLHLLPAFRPRRMLGRLFSLNKSAGRKS